MKSMYNTYGCGTQLFTTAPPNSKSLAVLVKLKIIRPLLGIHPVYHPVYHPDPPGSPSPSLAAGLAGLVDSAKRLGREEPGAPRAFGGSEARAGGWVLGCRVDIGGFPFQVRIYCNSLIYNPSIWIEHPFIWGSLLSSRSTLDSQGCPAV